MIEDSPSVCIYYFFKNLIANCPVKAQMRPKCGFIFQHGKHVQWKTSPRRNMEEAASPLWDAFICQGPGNMSVDKKMELKNFDAEVEGNHVEAQQTPEPKLNDLLNLYVFWFSFMCYNGPFKAQT